MVLSLNQSSIAMVCGEMTFRLEVPSADEPRGVS